MIMHKKSNYNVSCINTLEHLVKIVHIVFSDLCNYKIKKKRPISPTNPKWGYILTYSKKH